MNQTVEMIFSCVLLVKQTRSIKTIIVPQFSNHLQVWLVPVQELCKYSLNDVLVYACNLIFSTCLSSNTFKLYAVNYLGLPKVL